MVNDLVVSAGKGILKKTIERGVGKGVSDPVLVFFGVEGHAEKMLHEVQETLDDLGDRLASIDGKLDALMVRPLSAGFLGVEQAKNLRGKMRENVLAEAYHNFTEILAMDDVGQLGEGDIGEIRMAAYFGQSFALHALGDQDQDYVAELAMQGFLSHPTGARAYMSDKTWSSLVEEVYKGRSIAIFNFHARYNIDGDADVDIELKRFGNQVSIKGLYDDKRRSSSLLNYVGSTYSRDKRWQIPLKSGEYEFDGRGEVVEIKYHGSHIPRRGDSWGLRDHLHADLEPGMAHEFRVVVSKVDKGWFSRPDHNLSIWENWEEKKPIDLDDERYRGFTNKHPYAIDLNKDDYS